LLPDPWAIRDAGRFCGPPPAESNLDRGLTRPYVAAGKPEKLDEDLPRAGGYTRQQVDGLIRCPPWGMALRFAGRGARVPR
jgi:hypothetical protein